MLNELACLVAKTQRSGHKVLICGNGGLAAEAEHFAAELMGKFAREYFIPCVALTANTSLITALANDYGYEEVFGHQVTVLGQPGDLLIAMTTSASRNVRKAIQAGREKGLQTVCLCGGVTPELGADITIIAEGEGVAAIQEGILSVLHHAAWEAKERME